MAFIRRKTKGLATYYELVESTRVGKTVKQKVLKYFKNWDAMLKYAKETGVSVPKEGASEPLDKRTAEELELLLKKLESLRPLPLNTVESLRKKLEVELTYNSNAIEGNRLSLKETFLVLERGMTIGGRSVREHLEATNHRDALVSLETLLKKKRISEKDILSLHALILDKISPFDAELYRTERVYITGSGHIPPSWKEIPQLVDEQIVSKINSNRRGHFAIEIGAKVQHSLTWIHPFADGNGRIARLLTNLVLMRAGFPPIILEKRTRKTYYRCLELADKGNLTPFTRLIARQAKKSLNLWISAAEK
ncbi:MAG: Fic family protein [archaeon]